LFCPCCKLFCALAEVLYLLKVSLPFLLLKHKPDFCFPPVGARKPSLLLRGFGSVLSRPLCGPFLNNVRCLIDYLFPPSAFFFFFVKGHPLDFFLCRSPPLDRADLCKSGFGVLLGCLYNFKLPLLEIPETPPPHPPTLFPKRADPPLSCCGPS